MNLFGIGPLEVLLIAIVAVIVLGPERFPEVAVQLARAIKWLRGYATENTKDLREEFAELTREYEGLREELQVVRAQVRSPLTRATSELARIAERTKKDVEAVSPSRLLPSADAPVVEPGGDIPDDYQPADSAERSNNGA
ncbi:MAG TPA: twin-arginine translocase TatA/TatE family subunit [Dehalococcoidia bacterium]|nr:twin-arginine translocase TatA/TatE family subunit [Dehalococcoidia bacterium]